jgi:hypothetical protein
MRCLKEELTISTHRLLLSRGNNSVNLVVVNGKKRRLCYSKEKKREIR